MFLWYHLLHLYFFLFWTLESVVSGVGPHACTLARRQGISRPLRSHVGPYAGRKLVEKVEKVMTSRKWIHPHLSSSHPWIHLTLFCFSNVSDGKSCQIGSPKDHNPDDPSRIFWPKMPLAMTDLDRLASDASRLWLWWRVKEAYVRHRREMQMHPFDNWLNNGHHAAIISFTIIDPK